MSKLMYCIKCGSTESMSMEEVEVWEACLINFKCSTCEHFFTLYEEDYSQLSDREDKL